MLEPLTPVLHYPGIPMARFGMIDEAYGGGTRYRCIWAPSRMALCHPPTSAGVEAVYMYAGPRAIQPIGLAGDTKNAALTWILEKWLAPWQFYPGTEEQYNSDPELLASGLYPKRGEYFFCEAIHLPTLEYVEKVILMIEDGSRRHSAAENTVACVAGMEKREADRKKKKRDIIYNAMRPWGAESYSSALSMRNSKTYEQRYSANELGLPGAGVTQVRRPRRRVRYEVPVTV